MSGLREYQHKGADFIYENDRSMVLAPVGAGKTLTALTAMRDMLADGVVKRWLVLAPKRVAEYVWPAEVKKWTPSLTINVAVGAPGTRKAAIMRPSSIVVMNYDNLQWLAEKFPNLSSYFDGVVFDELTRLKNPSGKRFKAFVEVVEGINIRVGLTGSFTSNGLEDTFGQCKIIDQKLLGRSKGAFLQEYFILVNKEYGDWEPRVGSLQKVMERIKPATFLLEPGEYVDTLPPLHTVTVKCDFTVEEARKIYNKMKRDFVAEFPSAQIVAANSGAVTAKLQQMAGGWAYESTSTPSDVPGKIKTTKTPHWFSSHKFDALDDLLAENQRDNTLVFYWYQEDLAELRRRYPNAKTIDDKNIVERWNDGKVELLLLHPQSAGHGLNLQFGGSKMVFFSLPWSLELYEQAIGRLHRSGQKHAVWCYVLLTERTVDEDIFAALQDKRAISDVAIDTLKNS